MADQKTPLKMTDKPHDSAEWFAEHAPTYVSSLSAADRKTVEARMQKNPCIQSKPGSGKK